MRVEGLDDSNSNTMKRAIVFHPLVDIYITGIRIPVSIFPYSFGCFAIRKNQLSEIISKTRNGTLVYVKENK